MNLPLPRFNVVLLPIDAKIQSSFAGIAQEHFGGIATGYILGANALAHVTLCQFRASSDQVARGAFNSWSRTKDFDLRLEKFHFRTGRAEHAGKLWAEFLVERDPSLLEHQKECFLHLSQTGFAVLTPVETYSPHITLARIPAGAIASEPPPETLVYPSPVAFRFAVGISTDNGEFIKEL